MKEEISNVDFEDMKDDFSKHLKKDKSGSDSLAIEKDYALIKDVEVTINAFIGDTQISVEDLFSLKVGSVVSLQTKIDEPVTLYLKDKVIAKGSIVAVGDSFGIEISEIL